MMCTLCAHNLLHQLPSSPGTFASSQAFHFMPWATFLALLASKAEQEPYASAITIGTSTRCTALHSAERRQGRQHHAGHRAEGPDGSVKRHSLSPQRLIACDDAN